MTSIIILQYITWRETSVHHHHLSFHDIGRWWFNTGIDYFQVWRLLIPLCWAASWTRVTNYSTYTSTMS